MERRILLMAPVIERSFLERYSRWACQFSLSSIIIPRNFVVCNQLSIYVDGSRVVIFVGKWSDASACAFILIGWTEVHVTAFRHIDVEGITIHKLGDLFKNGISLDIGGFLG